MKDSTAVRLQLISDLASRARRHAAELAPDADRDRLILYAEDLENRAAALESSAASRASDLQANPASNQVRVQEQRQKAGPLSVPRPTRNPGVR